MKNNDIVLAGFSLGTTLSFILGFILAMGFSSTTDEK